MRTPYRLVGIMAEPNQQLGRPDKIGKYDRRCFGVDHRARVSAEHDTQFCNSLPILSRIARRLTSRNARRGRAGWFTKGRTLASLVTPFRWQRPWTTFRGLRPEWRPLRVEQGYPIQMIGRCIHRRWPDLEGSAA